jgi:hypothetical protein
MSGARQKICRAAFTRQPGDGESNMKNIVQGAPARKSKATNAAAKEFPRPVISARVTTEHMGELFKLMIRLGCSRRALGVGYFLIWKYWPISAKRGFDFCWPTYKQLTEDTGFNPKTIRRATDELHALEIIHKTPGLGKTNSSEYRPNFTLVQNQKGTELSTYDENQKGTELSTFDAGPEPKVDTRGVIKVDTRGNKKGDTRGVTNKLTPPNASEGEEVSPPAAPGPPGPNGPGPGLRGEAFEAFWIAYPRKEGRAKAKRLFDELGKSGEVSGETLVAKAQQYATAKAEVEQAYLKMPGNWLEGKCWLEDPKPKGQKAKAEPKPAKATEAAKKAKPEAKPKAQSKPAAEPQREGWRLIRRDTREWNAVQRTQNSMPLEEWISLAEGKVEMNGDTCWIKVELLEQAMGAAR